MKNRLRIYDPANDADVPTLMGFKIVQKQYGQVRAIFAETGQSDTLLLRALKEGHGIEFNSLTEDPMLFFVVSQQQTDGFKRAGFEPTMLQLLGSCEVIDTNEENAIRRFRDLKGA